MAAISTLLLFGLYHQPARFKGFSHRLPVLTTRLRDGHAQSVHELDPKRQTPPSSTLSCCFGLRTKLLLSINFTLTFQRFDVRVRVVVVVGVVTPVSGVQVQRHQHEKQHNQANSLHLALFHLLPANLSSKSNRKSPRRNHQGSQQTALNKEPKLKENRATGSI